MMLELGEDFSDWPPEKTVFRVDQVRMQVRSGNHPLYLAERDAIAANWQQETASNPALFDGPMILHEKIAVSEEAVVSEGYVVPFSAFLWWRKQPDRQGALHIYAYPVLEASDGALVAIRMGAHTANAGMVYFACGSFEPADIVDGYCDPERNMRREVLEETGIDLLAASPTAGYYVSHSNRAVTLFRVFRFDLTATEMVALIEEHMKVVEEQEIAGAVAIRSADHGAQPYHAGMLPVLDWYFSQEGPKQACTSGTARAV